MKNKLALLVTLIVNILISEHAFSQSSGAISTLCKADEFAYLNAAMGKIVDLNNPGKVQKNGKMVSLCADKIQEPFSKFIYRYGEVGKVEMERIASSDDKFGVYETSDGPHAGQRYIFFNNGHYNYYVVEATGQGLGVSLYVFKSGKPILHLFSGTDRGQDYMSGLIQNFFTSPVFILKKPQDPV